MEAIQSTLDALESNVTESQQKIGVLESELGLLRRQSVVMSASRNNSIRIKNFSVPRSQAEETIRSALEKSLKDALLAKGMAQQELENERQRWQEDQNHRISALEESLVAVEDLDKPGTNESSSQNEAIKDLRRQLREAIDEIDVLSQQHQSSLKSMRQLFDLVPDQRRKSQMELFTAHQQQLQQKIASIPSDSNGSVLSAARKLSSSGSSSSLSSSSSSGPVGFSMEALIARVKELVTRFQQMEQDNEELRQHIGKPTIRSRHASDENLAAQSQSEDNSKPQKSSDEQSTWILKSDLEKLQANAGMIQLLKKELDLLKQHTDVLMDENARLADLAAANATSSPAPDRSSAFGGIVQKPTRDETLDELQEIICVKDKMLRERDQIVQEQEKALHQAQEEIERIKGITGVDGAPRSVSPPLSSFDILAMENLRIKSFKLEEEVGEMRMIIAALESISGGPGTGSQLLKSPAVSSDAQSPQQTPSPSSDLGAVGSLSFGAPTPRQSSEESSGVSSPVSSSIDLFNGGSINALSPGGGPGGSSNNAMIAGATAALRKEFRRAMAESRDEKDKAVRKEVEERRRVEREVRQLRRELQAIQTSAKP
ncbi:hypothetical protein BGZ80_002728 [Entomortierella chlamydospora]|uniref:Involucrin repeat protein n=1 Tax=Entomortierella chlamydospora TaxID=101097 RepID=A0A9P6SWX9_9FUNG|nr:hypothetical protein BGZ80_002728 [Entomortierella chlamydospora]